MERVGPELPKCDRCHVPTSLRFNVGRGQRFGRWLPPEHVCVVCYRKRHRNHDRGRQGRLIPRSQVLPPENSPCPEQFR